MLLSAAIWVKYKKNGLEQVSWLRHCCVDVNRQKVKRFVKIDDAEDKNLSKKYQKRYLNFNLWTRHYYKKWSYEGSIGRSIIGLKILLYLNGINSHFKYFNWYGTFKASKRSRIKAGWWVQLYVKHTIQPKFSTQFPFKRQCLWTS